jgi:hypothetical protein
MCEQQYFIEYVLGYRGPSNKKADKGTICHKVLEILAHIKLCNQNNENIYNDDILGPIDTKTYNLDHIIEKVYEFYSSQFKHHQWETKDFKDCHKWSHKALTDHNGIFDPRSRLIVQPEQHFDIEIDKPWANYEYETKDGILKGKLAIKGTIDLITKVNDSTLEIIDWKTGRRLDWATGEEKTLEKLYKDPQLKIYHYALSRLYPQYDHVIMSINFINDGGAFSMCFDKSDLSSTEDLIRKKFEEIKKCKKPKLNKSWKCNKLCHFGKNNFSQVNTGILPILEYRENQLCQMGGYMTACEQIKHDIEMKGIKNVVDEYTSPGYSVGKYKAPGSTE